MNIQRTLLVASVLFSGVTASGCSGGDAARPVPLAQVPERDAIQGAPSTATVASTKLTLDGTVWRDSMPGADSPGVLASVTVSTVDKSAMPANLVLSRLFVVRGSEVWVSGLADEGQWAPPGSVARMARGGPDWPGRGTVDIVVRMDGPNGTIYLAQRAVEVQHPE